ncbi:MAG TPA: peptide-methionine (S)-S-oxide reductase MsrA [Calditrichia bacterium]|nr:peptide-methionine (S)-S-oxide reductase MsrA [Calditrichota bacterium]HQU72194.1 peptide-methionine (S)-S-oxide reductase MsrA [Calditrichia bacterium]HQV32236.1 peptide-methionine (S)-S-oxide reductase MsrA [Calditrichia bacterium]
MSESNTQLATLGAGCFWCVEAIFQRLKGVVHVESGYTGGQLANPTYEMVCSGATGHAEVARIEFDPLEISYEEILNVFWHIHDPTTPNRQGADIGTQYRSAIFYHDEQQRQIARESKASTDEAGLWDDPIVTEITPLSDYYTAEAYHQNYFNTHPNQGYCSAVVGPKVVKFMKQFSHLLKDPA